MVLDVNYPDLNFVSREYLDLLIVKFLEVFSPRLRQSSYVLCELAILTFGLLGLNCFWGARKLPGLFGACFVASSLVFVMGLDPFYLKFHWLPFLLVFYLKFHKERSLLSLLFASLVSLLWIFSAGALSPFGILLAVIVCHLSVHCGSDGKTAERMESGSIFLGKAFALLSSAALMLSIIAVPVYEMPDYPPGARLSPISPLIIYQPSPLIGPFLNPNPLVYSSVMSALYVYSYRAAIVMLLFLMLFLRILAKRKREESDAPFFLSAASISVLLFFFVALELVVPPEFGMYTPFRVICRLIPGMGLVGLPWMLLPFAILLGLTSVIRAGGALLLASLFFVMGLSVAIDYRFGALSKLLGPSSVSVDHFVQLEVADKLSWRQVVKQSPSGFVFNSQGRWVADVGNSKSREPENLFRLKKEADFNVSVKSSPNDHLAPLAIDGRDETRWSTERPQRKGDYFELHFDREVKIVRVVLSVKLNATDFPRGIFAEGSTDGSNYDVIINQPNWFGPLKWTEKGYPYFGSQGEVILDFPKPQIVSHLRFALLNSDNYYDWSIGEVKLYAPVED